MTCTPLLCVRSHDHICALTEHHASPYEAPNLSIQPDALRTQLMLSLCAQLAVSRDLDIAER